MDLTRRGLNGWQSMFTNKHVIIAMIVAPVLSVLAWLAVGQLTGEQAAPAQAGLSYPLAEQSNCRYPSDACDLENADFKLRLTLQENFDGLQMVVTATHPLDGILLQTNSAQRPSGMRASSGRRLEWRMELDALPMPEERIRLVARAGGSSYFGDVATTFLQPDDRPAN